jgi:hypothetical protein
VRVKVTSDKQSRQGGCYLFRVLLARFLHGTPMCCKHIRPVEADVPNRAQCNVAVADGAVRELCGERGRHAVHVGAAAVLWAGAVAGRIGRNGFCREGRWSEWVNGGSRLDGGGSAALLEVWLGWRENGKRSKQ